MDITLYPRTLRGTVNAIPSKSQAHRILICAAFSDQTTFVQCDQTNEDIEATADCLRSLGAKIIRTDHGYEVKPVKIIPAQATLNCRESGSTLRFMLPVVGALGVDATFQLAGRLPYRPLSPLWEEMQRMGCTLTRPTEDTIHCVGQLLPGRYTIRGNVSSQFITGLLFAAVLIPGYTNIEITGKLESEPYVKLTQQVLANFGVNTGNFCTKGSRPFKSPGTFTVEGDWSNGAFFLAAGALGCPVTVCGLDPDSTQGDRSCAQLFDGLKHGNLTINCSDIPDLVPILSVVAAYHHGATFENISRLRLKESDRVESVLNLLHALGAAAWADTDKMYVEPGSFSECTVDSVNDHRIAMAAAIAATTAHGPVTILGADCVKKSYPSFWEEYSRLGGHYEQYIR